MLKDLLVTDYPRVFSQTAILLNKVPYYIYGFSGTKAECVNIKTQEIEYIDFSTKPTLSLPKTGYINIRGTTVYVYRGAFRQYKHGLCYENIRFSLEHHTSKRESEIASSVMHDRYCLHRKYCYDMFIRKYPSLAMAVKKIQEWQGVSSVAFDPQFAISNDGLIFYRGRRNPVGYFRDGVVIFKDEHKELEKALPTKRKKK